MCEWLYENARVYGMASRRKGHILQLENQSLQILAEVMFSILQLENQRLQEVETLQRLCRWNALSDLRVRLRRVRVKTDK
ncbi:hypothetical protein AHAS_Ahas13G0269000 [Arachis hypogaea]